MPARHVKTGFWRCHHYRFVLTISNLISAARVAGFTIVSGSSFVIFITRSHGGCPQAGFEDTFAPAPRLRSETNKE